MQGPSSRSSYGTQLNDTNECSSRSDLDSSSARNMDKSSKSDAKESKIDWRYCGEQVAVVLFTVGFIMSAVAILTILLTPSSQNVKSRRIFYSFYPLGSLVMLTIFAKEQRTVPVNWYEKYRRSISLATLLSIVAIAFLITTLVIYGRVANAASVFVVQSVLCFKAAFARI